MFQRYIAHGGTPISRRDFEVNLKIKLDDDAFTDDIAPLLATENATAWNALRAAESVRAALLSLLP